MKYYMMKEDLQIFYFDCETERTHEINLIRHELLTKTEFKKYDRNSQDFICKYSTLIETSKNNVHTSFGVRFLNKGCNYKTV